MNKLKFIGNVSLIALAVFALKYFNEVLQAKGGKPTPLGVGWIA